MKIKELYSDKSKWTTNFLARTINGEGLNSVYHPDAFCYCLLGAIIKCYDNMTDRFAILDKINEKIKGKITKNVTYSEFTISVFNDNSDFATIKQLVEDLDI